MKDYVCVIGGANIDISSTSFNPLILHDSNPSKTTLSLGGVARNVAENLSRLGADVEFITVIGSDAYAAQIELSCKELGISTAHGLRRNCATSTYLCINDEKGDMFVAASDMEILSALDMDFLSTKKSVIDNAKAVIIDTNLSAELIEYITSSAKAPVFVETVSANKTKKIVGHKGGFAVKPNLIETEILAQMKISSDADLELAAEKLHGLGYEWVAVTLGERGAFYSDGKTNGFVKQTVNNIVNTTGAGDSFFAALVWGFTKSLDLKTCCVLGNRAAALTLMSEHTVNPSLAPDKIVQNLFKKVNNYEK